MMKRWLILFLCLTGCLEGPEHAYGPTDENVQMLAGSQFCVLRWPGSMGWDAQNYCSGSSSQSAKQIDQTWSTTRHEIRTEAELVNALSASSSGYVMVELMNDIVLTQTVRINSDAFIYGPGRLRFEAGGELKVGTSDWSKSCYIQDFYSSQSIAIKKTLRIVAQVEGAKIKSEGHAHVVFEGSSASTTLLEMDSGDIVVFWRGTYKVQANQLPNLVVYEAKLDVQRSNGQTVYINEIATQNSTLTSGNSYFYLSRACIDQATQYKSNLGYWTHGCRGWHHLTRQWNHCGGGQ